MKYFLFILMLLANRFSFGQLPAYHAQVFGPKQGLEAGRISIVFQDKHQFLWVASDVTIQRFDGRNVYKHNFEANVAQALCDRDNRIWVLSGQKIWRSSTDRWGFSEIAFDTVENGKPYIIFQLKGQPFCTITKKGLFSWDEKNKVFEHLVIALPPPSYIPGFNRFDTCGTTIFYPAKTGFIAADLATGRIRSIEVPKLFPTFCALTPDLAVLSSFDGNSVWLDFNKGTSTPIDAKNYGLSDRSRRVNLLDAEPIGDSLYLVTTRYGACTYDLRRDRFIRHRIFAEGKPIGLEESLVRVFQDDNGTFWAHNSSSVVAFSSIRHSIGLLRSFSDAPSQSWSNRVIGFTEDKNGNIWFGGFNGFNMLNLKTGAVETHPPVDDATDRLSHISVRGMAYDGRYLILGPTLKGMWLYEPGSDRFFRPRFATDSVQSAINREFVNGILPLRDGNFLVCGRYHAYLLKKHTHLLNFLELNDFRGDIKAACQDSMGRIWLAHPKGLVVLGADYRFLFNIVSDEEVLSVFQKSADEMLAGTRNGLRRLMPASDRGKWSKIEGPLEKVTVRLMHRDGRGRLWFGTDDGLFLTDAQIKTVRHFDFADNIQSAVYYPFSLLQASDGLLFLGGRNGINYFYPETIELETRPLAVTLQTLTLGDGDSIIWNPGRQLQFSHTQNTLTFEVVTPYYNNAGKLQYRYRLKPNAPWINTGGSPIIRLAELPHGNYRLEVTASVDGARWYPAPAVDFRILPAFWQRPAFIAVVAIVLLFLLFYFIRYRENAMRKNQERTLELEKLKTTALQYELEMEQVINYFNRSIAKAGTVEEALWDIAQQCIARLGLEDCVIYLLDSERQVLLQTAAWGEKSSPDLKIVDPIEIPVGRGIVGTVAKTGQAELVADTAGDGRYIADDASRRSELAVPILDGERVIGVIDTENSQKGFYTTWHLQLFTAIASLCSNKIALARSEESRREALLETVNSQRKAAEAKLQSLRLQMNPHFLFNALNSIQELILTGNTDGAAMYLSKFSKLLRAVLTHSDQELLSLREEIDILQLYLELESLRFYDTFEYRIECEAGIDPDEYKVPTLLFQPFVENAIWHGLLHKEGLRRLSVRFETDAEENLICTIEDNGIGRTAAQKAKTNGRHTGKGMSSGAERLEALSKRHNNRNSLEILDLLAADGTPAGTRVRITLS